NHKNTQISESNPKLCPPIISNSEFTRIPLLSIATTFLPLPSIDQRLPSLAAHVTVEHAAYLAWSPLQSLASAHLTITHLY
ncbi:hypothetical protein S245_058556, partial [Arachis hypogaea]